MIHYSWNPGCGRMTIITGSCGLDVGWILAGGRCAVMTAGTGSGDLQVVDAGGRHPAGGAMAGLAVG